MQIKLSPENEERVNLRAAAEDRSPTQIVNRFLEKMPTKAQEDGRIAAEREHLAEIVGLVRGGKGRR